MPTFKGTEGSAGADTLVDGIGDHTLAGAAGADVPCTSGERALEPRPDVDVRPGDHAAVDPEGRRSAPRLAAASDRRARVEPRRGSTERPILRQVQDAARNGPKLNGNLKRVDSGVQLRCEAGARTRQVVILSGWASQIQTLPDGRRQIFALLLPGDSFFLDEHAERRGRGVVALTRLTVMETGKSSLTEDDTWRSLQRATREAALEKEKRLMDHMVRIGRLNARERVLHLLLELYERLDAVGLVKDDTFRMPLTQETLADALGLSAVHINRTLRQLNREGQIRLKHRSVTLPARDKLAALTFYGPARS